MHSDSRRDHFFIYPRDEHGNLTGHTYCVILRNGRMYEGMAYCSVHDQFDRKVGRELALVRAKEASERHQKYIDENSFVL